MSIAAKKITQTFNGRAEWIVGGASFFKLLGTVNPVDVELYMAGGGALTAMQVDSGFYQRIPFDRVVITTGALEPVSFLVAPDEGGSDTFSGVVSGTIDVTDRAGRLLGVANLDPEDARYYLFGDYETSSDRAFHSTAAPGPVAGQVSFVQLWNPAGSGKVGYIDKMIFSTFTASQRFEIRENNAALGAVAGEFNKNLGGAAAALEFRQGSSAAPGGTVVQNGIVIVNEEAMREFKAPLRVPEGRGVILTGFTVNQQTLGTIEWRERTA